MIEIVLATALAVIAFRSGEIFARSTTRIFVLAALVWLLGQVLSDLANASELDHSVIALSRIAWTVINLVALSALLRDRSRRYAHFGLGVGIGLLLDAAISPSAILIANPWKFGVGLGTVLVLLSLPGVLSSSRFLTHWAYGPTMLMALGSVGVATSSRSYAGLALLAAGVLVLARLAPRSHDSWRVIWAAAGIVAAISGGYQGYLALAQEGILGRDAAERVSAQMIDGSLIRGARPDVAVSVAAAADRPFVGYGSGGRSPTHADQFLRTTSRYGLNVDRSIAETGAIPLHSHVFAAWVEAGILALPFWLTAAAVVFTGAMRVAQSRSAAPLTPLAALLGVTAMWDIFFSPYGAERRFLLPFVLLLMTQLREVHGHDAEV